MRVLEYAGLDTHRVKAQFAKVRAALERGDFRSAEVKKLGAGTAQGSFYRARLDDSNRLLFTLFKYQEQGCVLLLEVILNHDYGSSRFLRGALVDESKIVDVSAEQAAVEARPIRYLHPERTQVQLLDKPLSFDDAQHAIYLQPAPLILVGSAGSGKTALTLEKLKQIDGEVLYVTHSAFLAQSARDLFYAHGFERAEQDASFLSYREFLETLEVPAGQEANWPRFRAWFARMSQAFRGLDAHQAYEEIRGVITAQSTGPLARDDYLALGVRQSIFADDQRAQAYDLYERYRAWLNADQLFDLNLLAHAHLALAAPRYDFVVVDEVQDLTPVQLALILKTLRKPGQFLLCGDSNQIVHPNFFSWSQVKTLFWNDAELAARQHLQILTANYRNAAKITTLANTLLKIKHRRFSSIDRESNYLVASIGAEPGDASLLSDRDTALKGLDEQSRRSTQIAVLVLRDEDKAAARQRFRTPLLFSVHEAKGLEYEHIILYRFISDHRAEFAEIADGVSAADLTEDILEYRRARDKSDKSLEIYKFYVNALYVALTRAVRNLYLVESDLDHPLLALLPLANSDVGMLRTQASSQEDWQREARRLELQGKQEQAEAIRRDVLKQTLPPWPVFDGKRFSEALTKVFRERYPSNKLQQQLLEYASYFDHPVLAEDLENDFRIGSRAAFAGAVGAYRSRHLAPYAPNKNFKEILRQCDQYGTEFRSLMNHTPLMQATIAGNLPLVEALIGRGADLDAADQYGQTAVHLALQRAFADPVYARESLPALYARVAPAMLDLKVADRLVRLDRHRIEYVLLQTMWALLPRLYTRASAFRIGVGAGDILGAWKTLPVSVIHPDRNRRTYLSGVLSRNEAGADYAYSRRLFQRLAHGRYALAPSLQMRVCQNGEATWISCVERLNLPLLLESVGIWICEDLAKSIGVPASDLASGRIERLRLLRQKMHEHEAALLLAERQQLLMERQRLTAERARIAQVSQRARHEQVALQRQRAAADQRKVEEARRALEVSAPIEPGSGSVTEPKPEPPWGTPAARRLALERAALLRKPK